MEGLPWAFRVIKYPLFNDNIKDMSNIRLPLNPLMIVESNVVSNDLVLTSLYGGIQFRFIIRRHRMQRNKTCH